MVTKFIRRSVFIVLLGSFACGAALAGSEADEWQLKRLFHPTEKQLQSEGKGSIFIYDGLTDRQVAQAMNQEFERVDFMMFINVKKTDPRGEVMKDPATGEPITEDDDC